jgi:mediator of replication checkpoint protein 1
MLRRKRGADYDLSDSDDGGEGRKRRKRAEFAKMRKALLSDERIGKIAENPKRQAFLRAIEDQRDDDEMDFLDEYREVEDTESQSQTQDEDSQHRVPNSQPTDMGPPPPRESANASDPSVRPPAALRRTKPARKPANLSEVRESLSSLIEEPNTLVQTVDLGSDSEDELEIDGEPGKEGGQKENRNPFALRRTSTAVIDRTLVKRQSSSTLSASTRLAFSASTAAATFKVPALLRKATTNSSIASTTSTVGMERMAGGASDGVRRGGSRTSGVNFFARENERKANVVKVEKRREQKRMKGAEGRRKAVGGLLGSGKFE